MALETAAGFYQCYGEPVTILVVLKVAEGLVLAADSRLTVTAGDCTVFTSDSQRKLFAVRDRPIGILTCGAAFLGGRSIASWLAEFCMTDAPTCADLDGILRLLIDKLPPPDQGSISFVVAGFEQGAAHGPDARIFKVNRFDCGTVHRFDLSDSAIFWDGEFEAITRLLLGFAPAYAPIVTGSASFGAGEVRVPYYAFSLAEGADYVHFLVHTQVQFQRFAAVPQTCGGPIDVATITPGEGWRWLARK